MNRFVLSLIHGAIIGIVSVGIVAIVIGPAMPQNDRVFVPVDRVALPASELACECEIGNGCKCDGCKCEEPATIQVVEKPQPPKVLSVDPTTGFAATKPAVVMISRPWCGPCQAWKNGPMPGQLVSQGWDFAVDENASAKVFPTYRIFDGRKWHTVSGPLTPLRLRMVLSLTIRPAIPMRERVQSQGTSWPIDSEPWTRESLIDHLVNSPNHQYNRQSIEGLTFEQIDKLHTEDHERTTVEQLR